LSRGSSPSGYPAEPLVSFQINRQLSGWNLPPLVIRAFGAHGQQETSRALPRAAANCILRRIAPGGHVSCSFLALVLKKELEERIADLGRAARSGNRKTCELTTRVSSS
jgi:hypothetical protein